MSVVDDLLEKTCKNMIKTILFCLDNATKGTIYRIGPMPVLQAVRVTSGSRREGSGEIQWGLPAVSDYNPPGKSWNQYKDQPGHVLEAMGWCVEKQKSWTAENPYEDVRSVGKQLRGEIEDFYHMEPVLVRKEDLYGKCTDHLEFPRDWQGKPIWEESEYVVAAVIKIHFLPYTLRREDRSTRIISELSRTLGTELLSLHFRETLYRSQKELARQRMESCQILAHELRNTLIKFGFLFSAVNAEIGVLREEWEKQLKTAFPEMEWKSVILVRLNELITLKLPEVDGSEELVSLCRMLLEEQKELAEISLLPHQEEQWITNKIQPKWEHLLGAFSQWEDSRAEIQGLLERLRVSVRQGMDRDLAARLTNIPPLVRESWGRLAYVHFTADRIEILEDIIRLLDDPDLPVPNKRQMKKVIKSLKALVEVLPEVEERANRIILSLRRGSDAEQSAPLQDQSCTLLSSP